LILRERGEPRVVITGAGILCSLGNCAVDCWEALREGRPAIAPIQSVDVRGLRFQNGAEIRGFHPEEHFDDGQCEQLDRFAQLAVVAARQAMRQAGYERFADVSRATDRANFAVVTGTSMGGQSSLDRGFAAIYKDGRPRPHPFTIPLTMCNAGACHIAQDQGITGQAFWMVRSGAVDAALCGGSEAPFSPGILRAWEAMRVVAPDACRPFSRDRKGMILGEGAAMFVLERAERAQARGATVLGELAGFGMSADAGHLTLPSIEGPAAAMRAALADAGLAPEEVDYINAHGTGTRANDATETQAIRRVFGAHAGELAVSSSKSMHGHALGASGALEAFSTLMALREGVLPPTANFTESDPDCDLDVIPNRARHKAASVALSNSFAFGGLNAVLALRRWERGSPVRPQRPAGGKDA
jgi:nodulation protein E